MHVVATKSMKLGCLAFLFAIASTACGEDTKYSSRDVDSFREIQLSDRDRCDSFRNAHKELGADLPILILVDQKFPDSLNSVSVQSNDEGLLEVYGGKNYVEDAHVIYCPETKGVAGKSPTPKSLEGRHIRTSCFRFEFLYNDSPDWEDIAVVPDLNGVSNFSIVDMDWGGMNIIHTVDAVDAIDPVVYDVKCVSEIREGSHSSDGDNSKVLTRLVFGLESTRIDEVVFRLLEPGSDKSSESSSLDVTVKGRVFSFGRDMENLWARLFFRKKETITSDIEPSLLVSSVSHAAMITDSRSPRMFSTQFQVPFDNDENFNLDDLFITMPRLAIGFERDGESESILSSKILPHLYSLKNNLDYYIGTGYEQLYQANVIRFSKD